MRVASTLFVASLYAGFALTANSIALAGGTHKVLAAARKKDPHAARPALPSGATPSSGAASAYYGGPSLDTIKEYRNGAGQLVYSVAASHFDVSRPLIEMAAATGKTKAAEMEPPTNPQLPLWRIIRSDTPDPVVHVVPSFVESLSGGPALAAPSTGFNFLGVGINGSTPSDSNGSVGGNQFVETVNSRYEVWSLDRASHSATPALGPANINTLWAGFGGACEAQNSGDPIVVFDKVAKRWLISQFTTSTAMTGGVYFQCVAVSTTTDATGTYARYAFAVPNNRFGDYPHFGVWSDAYYMMAHAFTSTSGGYVAALFAAMDRGKMLAGDPGATWQVIEDPNEGGHMPADLDGYAPPPTGAPGVFLSLHETGMFVYRMMVDFATPANTVRTTQAIVPVASSSAACGGGSCIPQPGTTVTVGSLADRLMFRAAYRNLVDHESLVVSHSVDPSVAGVVSGVRWYDFRLSGTPDATCASYPCLYQQGTIADVADGRSRWMPSIAMDAGENILVGYSVTGKTDGTENHSIRYTGRAKSDPPGSMTVPETTLATGTANNGNSRWGDYTSMSVDPNDDCAFWYVNQYFTAPNAWSTQIASASWPVGSGPGQCPAAQCLFRPTSAPTIGTASVPGDNQIRVTWTGIVPAPGAYAIERADGACGSEGPYRPLAATNGAASSYVDSTVMGGLTYSYRVIAARDAAGRCQGLVASGCVSATATGACSLKPSFGGATAASSGQGNNCGVTISWNPGASSCPLTPSLRYNVFRGTVPDFLPSVANRIATCVAGPSSYLDTANLSSGTTYYYVVRAEDGSVGNGGECGGGNEEANGVVIPGTPYRPGTQAGPGIWTDGAGDVTGTLQMNVAGPGDTADRAWRYVRTADDPGANHTPGGAYAYRNAGPGPSSTYGANVCAEIQAAPLKLGATSVNLQYWERHQIEYHWDAVAVEYSIQGGDWTDVPAPSNSPADGCDPSDVTTGWEPLSCTMNPPINACGYSASKNAYNGPLGSGVSCDNWATSGSLPPYAHRCHRITGLTPGTTIQFRWRFSSDPGSEFAGFYLDDLAVTNIRLPRTCTPDTCAGQANGTACDDGDACTVGDSCSSGTCQPGAMQCPAEVDGLLVNGHSNTSLTWNALPGGVVYDVVSSTLSDLRQNDTTTAACLANNLGSPSTSDGRPNPAPGDGYYYLIRAQSPGGSGTFGTDSSGAQRQPAPGCS